MLRCRWRTGRCWMGGCPGPTDRAANVVQMILGGGGRRGTPHPYLSSFSRSYSNAEIAAVANYVTARSVARLRASRRPTLRTFAGRTEVTRGVLFTLDVACRGKIKFCAAPRGNSGPSKPDYLRRMRQSGWGALGIACQRRPTPSTPIYRVIRRRMGRTAKRLALRPRADLPPMNH